ncbi:MAG: hypothetical protein Q9227_009317 [Pyrenula ochraceoflavens]
MSAKVRTPSSHHHRSSHSRSSTNTPYGLPPKTPSADQSTMSKLTPKDRRTQDPRTPSPNYFGFVSEHSNPPGSNPGAHAQKNWEFPPSQTRSTVAQPRSVAVEENPEFAAFRRQSEQNNTFYLRNGSLPSVGSPPQNSKMPIPGRDSSRDIENRRETVTAKSPPFREKSPFNQILNDAPRKESPSPLTSAGKLADTDHHGRLSLPTQSHHNATAQSSKQLPPRSETVPASPLDSRGPAMISAQECAELLASMPDQILLLDLRVYPQYQASRIKSALNLCIPTTLLKRPSFDIKKLADTFASESEKERFSCWKNAMHIIVYDQNSLHLKEAIAPLNVLKKFPNDHWAGRPAILKGGFLEFEKLCPDMVNYKSATAGTESSKQTLSMAPVAPGIAPVAGGCPMPDTQKPANPFFGNIRQNMDLIDGVGQIQLTYPDSMEKEDADLLPLWLREAAEPRDEGKKIADKFLNIEKTEQKRMQNALSGKVNYGTPKGDHAQEIRIAGIEKGSKNRYNNIFPYDHSRVRLQDVPMSECDYVNASYVETTFSNKRYIATQAPIPATFNDFWRVLWEQDARVVVMLTAESEGGQVKSHAYWHTGDYGPLKVKLLSEKRIPLDQRRPPSAIDNSSLKRPTLGQRRSTNPHTALEKQSAKESGKSNSEPLFMVQRHFTISHSAFPFQPMREITQIQYAHWPDFGAPASPSHLLNLIEQVSKAVRGTSTPGPATPGLNDPVPEAQRPLVVHCSAGCGRTGTFCTVDSVLDMLRRQRLERTAKSPTKNETRAHERHPDAMDVDEPESQEEDSDWVFRDDIDFVEKAVIDFRSQRLSMVQSLRQFVLCYESILEWLVERAPSITGAPQRPSLLTGGKDARKAGGRFSYHGKLG